MCLHHALRPVCFPLICYRIVLNFEEHTFRGFQRMYCNYELYACEILLCACLHAHILHELQTLCHKMLTESNPQKLSRKNLPLHGMSILYTASEEAVASLHIVGGALGYSRASISLPNTYVWKIIRLNRTFGKSKDHSKGILSYP